MKNDSIQTLPPRGEVLDAFGNLLRISFEGHIRNGEVCYVEAGDDLLKAEVIEIIGTTAKVQVFEDTTGVKHRSKVRFDHHLLEAELGPGLLSAVVDGLQNPLDEVAKETGMFLKRGVYLPSINRSKKWKFTPTKNVGDTVSRGDEIGFTLENNFHHSIMVPFKLNDKYTLISVTAGEYTVNDEIAQIQSEDGAIHSVTMLQKWPVKLPLSEGNKVKATEMMDTGLRVLDTQFPIVKGGTFCSPGPFGAGKTVMQHHISKYASVDIVVVCACGERAGEVVEVLKTFPLLTDPHTNEPLINRTAIICNTSSMPVSAREASVYLGVTIAEYYRQMGLNVLLLADSTSRWAQAMREMSGRLEEIPGEEAFPAYLSSRIAAFYERSGVLELKNGQRGSVTIGGTVSPAGGNFEEPVTQATLAVVGAFLGLSRERSDARKYPAIDPHISWSKYRAKTSKVMNAQFKNWESTVSKSDTILSSGDEIGKRMEVVGEEGVTIDDIVIFLKAELYDFVYLQQNAFDPEDAYCPLKRQIDLMKIIGSLYDASLDFVSHDDARTFFMTLQNDIKNLNYISFETQPYQTLRASIFQMIDSKIKR